MSQQIPGGPDWKPAARAEAIGSSGREWARRHHAELPRMLEGQQAVFRVGFNSMSIPSLPSGIQIGRVIIDQVEGPVTTQVTVVDQRPGWRPRFSKKMSREDVGNTEYITLARLPVSVPKDVLQAMDDWLAEVLGAVGLLVCLFDERVAQQLVLQDLLLVDQTGEVVAALDYVPRLRTFQPTSRVLASHIREISDLRLNGPERFYTGAARWYLRAAQLGPTVEAILFHWIALEALSRPPEGTKLTRSEKSRTQVQWVETAVQEAGITLSDLGITIGRLADLRARIAHKGIESHDLVSPAYYQLEALNRLLLRHRFGMKSGWPIWPSRNMLRAPLGAIAQLLYRRPITVWEEPEREE